LNAVTRVAAARGAYQDQRARIDAGGEAPHLPLGRQSGFSAAG
jgi:hypothetical protein